MNEVKNACIIDDDAIFVTITTKIIRQHDIFENVLIYNDGQQALKGLTDIIQSGDLMPEIILLDLNMPEINGWEFLDEFSETLYRHKIPVFIVSSSIDQFDIEKSRSYKCVLDYIVKPLSRDDLFKIKGEYNENRY
ncbi:response regulator [Salinimicrobium sp. TIG7-5_MAKvit]|uniref:response regulator n=1 Tax=Salinimicrobium sp. TIG7-5_MAKvit TaxID=3121289 RepID=UPI003C6E6BB0